VSDLNIYRSLPGLDNRWRSILFDAGIYTSYGDSPDEHAYTDDEIRRLVATLCTRGGIDALMPAILMAAWPRLKPEIERLIDERMGVRRAS